jgi:SP family sugar:H+ symporter-like MFS transporter
LSICLDLTIIIGLNYFLLFGTTIFSSVGLADRFGAQFILGAVNVAFTFVGLHMVAIFGRRICLITGALWQFACWVVFASLGTFKLHTGEFDTNGVEGTHHDIGMAMFIVACLFITSSASTWGPLTWVVVVEMYPERYRSTAISFCASSNVSHSLPSNLYKEAFADESFSGSGISTLS